MSIIGKIHLKVPIKILSECTEYNEHFYFIFILIYFVFRPPDEQSPTKVTSRKMCPFVVSGYPYKLGRRSHVILTFKKCLFSSDYLSTKIPKGTRGMLKPRNTGPHGTDIGLTNSLSKIE